MVQYGLAITGQGRQTVGITTVGLQHTTFWVGLVQSKGIIKTVTQVARYWNELWIYERIFTR
jgi:hypothetical protein